MLNQELRDLIAARSEVRFGFSRPDWHKIRADVAQAGANFERLSTGAARMWMDTIASEFGSSARVHVEGCRTYAMLPASETAKETQRWVENCIRELHTLLSGIVREQGEHLVVLLFDDREAFVSYVTDYYTDDGEEVEDAEEFGDWGGHFADDGFPKIVAPVYGGASRMSLAHDLTSSMLEHLRLPAWLYSGIVQSMAGILANRDMRPSAGDMTTVRRAWNAESIQRFWAGESFSDSYGTAPSHTMAHVFVQSLSGSYERLVRLVTRPDLSIDDAGDAAFRAEYGHGLEHLVARLLGEGEWAPNREAIEQIRADARAEEDALDDDE